MELIVEGRTAVAFDIELGGDCVTGGDQPVSGTAFWFQAGEHHRPRRAGPGRDPANDEPGQQSLERRPDHDPDDVRPRLRRRDQRAEAVEDAENAAEQ